MSFKSSATFMLTSDFGVLADAERKGDILKHIHMPEQGIMLEHEADTAGGGMGLGRLDPANGDAARVRLVQPGDEAQQGGFARARRAKQRQQLALVHGEVHVIEHRMAVEAARDIGNGDFSGHYAVLFRFTALSSSRSRNSTAALATSVTKASSASSEATAKAAWIS